MSAKKPDPEEENSEAWDDDTDAAWDDAAEEECPFETAMEHGKRVYYDSLDSGNTGDCGRSIHHWAEKYWLTSSGFDRAGPYDSLNEALHECGHTAFYAHGVNTVECKALPQDLLVALLESAWKSCMNMVIQEKWTWFAYVLINDQPYVATQDHKLLPLKDSSAFLASYDHFVRLPEGGYLVCARKGDWDESTGPFRHLSPEQLIGKVNWREQALELRKFARRQKDEQLLVLLKPLLAKGGGLPYEDEPNEERT